MVVFWPFAWGLTMAAKTLLLPIESFSMILAFGFIGASILHRRVNLLLPLDRRPYLLSLSVGIPSFTLFYCCSWSLKGAGCVWNDILDQDFDRQVGELLQNPNVRFCVWLVVTERTKNRPIANGSISTTGGLLFLFAHIAILIAINWKSNIVA